MPEEPEPVFMEKLCNSVMQTVTTCTKKCEENVKKYGQ